MSGLYISLWISSFIWAITIEFGELVDTWITDVLCWYENLSSQFQKLPKHFGLI